MANYGHFLSKEGVTQNVMWIKQFKCGLTMIFCGSTLSWCKSPQFEIFRAGMIVQWSSMYEFKY